MNSPYPPRLLTDEQVANYVNVPKSWIRSLVESGDLPAPREYRISRGKRARLLWDKAAIDALQDQRSGLAGEGGRAGDSADLIDDMIVARR